MTNFLEHLHFDNRFIEQLPADPSEENHSRSVLDACYSFVSPRVASSPLLISYSKEVLELLDINSEDTEDEQFANIFVGNEQLVGMKSYATCYGGHQFGQWAGQLGDGRAINLGEIINSQQQRWALQLKGAGPTPYSRRADGLAVLRSSIREYLCSEAMYHLGVPTTRALSICLTGDHVPRDMFYDGNVIDEPGAVVCRVAPSFTRFGHFQILAAQQSEDHELLKKFIDFTINTDFPELLTDGATLNKALYKTWFKEVCDRTREMIIHWMRVGFVHGVMNTDNMSILGLTIDYGPYGWLEDFDEQWTPNTTDASGKRYCFGRQASMAHWNLAQLAQAIAPVVDDVVSLKQSLEGFCHDYERDYHQMMLNKLGLSSVDDKIDQQLIIDLLNILQLTETDMTIFFRQLADLNVEALASKDIDGIPAHLMAAYYQIDSITDDIELSICQWLKQYSKRVLSELSHPTELSNELSLEISAKQLAQRKQAMNRVNPKYVLRNYLAQQAIDDSEQGDHQLLNELLDVMRNPYSEQDGREKFAEKRPEWARNRAGCSMLSCSS